MVQSPLPVRNLTGHAQDKKVEFLVNTLASVTCHLYSDVDSESMNYAPYMRTAHEVAGSAATTRQALLHLPGAPYPGKRDLSRSRLNASEAI